MPEDFDGLEFRTATRDDDEQLRAINAEVFPANPKARAEVTAWQWWDSPFGDTIAYVWTDRERIVGQYLAYPMPAVLDGRPGRVSIGVDAGVAKTHRGRGLLAPLMTAVSDASLRAGMPMYSLPNEQSVHAARKHGGWSEVGSLDVLVLPTDAAALAARLHLPRTGGTALASVAQRLIQARSRRVDGVTTAVAPATAETVPEGIDELWNRVVAHHPWGVARTSAWFRWRYAAHPDHPYTFTTAHRDGRLVGLAATRIRDDLGGRFCCVLDLIADDEHAARSMVAALRDRTEVDRIDGIAATSMPDSRQALLLRAAGLVRIPQRVLPRPVHFFVIPHPTLVPDPAAVPWSTAWGDLDHI